MKSLTLPASHPRACADPEGGGGGLGSPGKSQVIWVSLEINIRKKLDPLPMENSGPPLDPLKSIVFSVIKPLDPLC